MTNDWSADTIIHETDMELAERLRIMTGPNETPGRVFALLEAARRLIEYSHKLGITWRNCK